MVREKPLLNVCSGRSPWGDTKVDKYLKADFNQDWTELNFPADSYGAVFADPPWNAAYKPQCSRFMKRALKIAPVVYLMAPWIYGSSEATLTNAWFRQLPGINTIVAITRYERPNPESIADQKAPEGEKSA